MKKRILALMLTLAMVLSVLPGAVFAADTADNDILTYADLSDIDKDIVIPDEASERQSCRLQMQSAHCCCGPV